MLWWLLACVEPDAMTPHAHFVQDAAMTALPTERVPPPAPIRQPGDRPDRTVYGYWPYWGDPLDTLQWDQLTHVALFSVGMNTAGDLTDTSRWTNNAATALALAAPYGVRVHITLTSFDDAVTNVVLASPALRARVISQLAAQVSQRGAHGVNVDIEGLDFAQRNNFVAFVQELAAATGDVFLAVPAVDWSGSYDYDVLAAASDGLFIMGYDYHWSGGDPGPVAPLRGGGLWSQYSLEWTVDDYRSWGAPDDKLILGLPLYGKDWPTTNTNVPGTATGNATSVLYADAVSAGYARQWDAGSATPYAFPSNTRQIWYDDADSVTQKMELAVDEGLQGFGFWALTYDDADRTLWLNVDALTHSAAGMAVAAPTPGLAGVNNLLQVTGARSNGRVRFVVGLRSGSQLLPGCNVSVDAARIDTTSIVTVNGAGEGSMMTYVPRAAMGRTVKLWAYDVDTCAVSPPRTVSL
jgi:hypothetical protein